MGLMKHSGHSGPNSINPHPGYVCGQFIGGVPIHVTTDPATAIQSTQADLNGTANPNSVLTNVYFEYGLTNVYGSTTAPVSIGSGSVDVGVTIPITGLTASTTYHFRVVAVNAFGTTLGADRTFSTVAPLVYVSELALGASYFGGTGGVLDPTSDNLYVGNQGTVSRVAHINLPALTLNADIPLVTDSQSEAVAHALVGTTLYVVCGDTALNGMTLYSIDTLTNVGTKINKFTTGFNGVDNVVYDAINNWLWVTSNDIGSPSLWKLTLAGVGTRFDLSANISSPVGLAVDPTGQYVYVGGPSAGPHAIARFNIGTLSVDKTATTPVATTIFDISYDTVNNVVYAGTFNGVNPNIYKYSIDLATRTTVNNLSFPPTTIGLWPEQDLLFYATASSPTNLGMIRMSTGLELFSVVVPGGHSVNNTSCLIDKVRSILYVIGNDVANVVSKFQINL